MIDSIQMIVTLPADKVEKVIGECTKLFNKQTCSLRELAKVIGILVSVFPAVEQGPMHYRNLEINKIDGLKTHKGDFDGKIKIDLEMKSDLEWWIDNIKNQCRVIDHGNPEFVITTDASMSGWGAVCNGTKIGGRWDKEEMSHHINYLELLATFYALKSFCKNSKSTHIGLLVDNTCAIAYINNMGGTKSLLCNKLSYDIWIWCIQKDIWISANYINTSQNIADIESRKFNENIEWMLNEEIFQTLTEKWGVPDIDLFATKSNSQLPKYCSWKPDPDCEFVNAFSVNWSNLFCYAFPPFSLMGRVVQKIRQDRADCVVVAPMWPTQSWFSVLLQMLIDHPVILPKTEKLLTINYTNKLHPLRDKLKLMACIVSGNRTKSETFLQKQLKSCLHHGDLVRKDNIQHILESGQTFVVKGRLIHFDVI